MKIRPNGLHGPQSGAAAGSTGADRADKASRSGTAAGGSGASGAVAPAGDSRFSSSIKTLSAQVASGSAVDTAKVERISKAIADGTFKVDSSAVADKMVQGALDMLGKTK